MRVFNVLKFYFFVYLSDKPENQPGGFVENFRVDDEVYTSIITPRNVTGTTGSSTLSQLSVSNDRTLLSGFAEYGQWLSSMLAK